MFVVEQFRLHISKFDDVFKWIYLYTYVSWNSGLRSEKYITLGCCFQKWSPKGTSRCRKGGCWKQIFIDTVNFPTTLIIVAILINQVVEWILSITKHVPSEEQCQKCITAPLEEKDNERDLLYLRSICYEMIKKVFHIFRHFLKKCPHVKLYFLW